MKTKYYALLEDIAASRNCSLREAARQIYQEHYSKRGYTEVFLRETADNMTDEKLFFVFEHIQEYKEKPKYKHTPPFRF
jgi:hypothetical protein